MKPSMGVQILLVLIVPSSASLIWDLQLKSQPGTPYAKLNVDIPELKQFTACFWSFPTKSVYTIISYATPKRPNDIVYAVNYTSTVILIANKKVTIRDDSPPMKKWTHLCLAWKSENGQVLLYKNGKSTGVKPVLVQGESVQANGVFILGQDQDWMGGGFDSHQGLSGRISEVHMWNRTLNDDEVAAASKCSPKPPGNIINWRTSPWLLDSFAEPTASTVPCNPKLC